MPNLRSLHTSTTSRYIAIGVSVYLIELTIIFLMQRLGYRDTIAVAVSFWVGLFVSFIMQKLITFRDKRMHHKVLLPQIIAVSCLVLFNFIFTLVLTKLLRNHAPTAVTRTIALGITSLWNFYIYRTRIFNNTNSALLD